MKLTTVIPAYKSKYLSDLLVALSNQTVKPDRVIFSDDSPDRSFTTALSSESAKAVRAHLNIEVIQGPRRGATANWRHLMNTWNGSTPLIHFLMDDDVIYPEFYERHLAVHSGDGVNCTVSRRWTAVESGQPIGQLPRPEQVAKHPERTLALGADFVFASTIPSCNNWFGELSNCVLNVKGAQLLDKSSLGEISFEGLGDIGLFIAASVDKPLGYINETLSSFRLNSHQNSQNPNSQDSKRAHVAWIALALASRRLGKLSQSQVIQSMLTINRVITLRFAGLPDMKGYFDAFPGLIAADPTAEANFLHWWNAYVTKQ
ncbi:Glycosyl transferase family 2 [Paraburkholderia fungorum]|uniref:Glycosyl transferase family 2 n=1 Tax=Paraburkholderia fungorum TaxID=134537 RepID=A0A1H0YNF1_9BURK|nr:glycosyltransferase family A protein [Paraburkholderia fungorum]SDQ16471.1 Glycosyl transferase family 2 [Paraburkholderia fungorum]